MLIKRLLCFTAALIMSVQICVFAEDEKSNVQIIEATLENAVEYSKGMEYTSIDPILNDDHSMALLYTEAQNGPAYAVYKSDEPFRSFAVETYMNTWSRVNLKFYVSKDGKEWKFADIQLYDMGKTKHNDVWEATQQMHRAYEGSRLEDEYSYLKLEYPEYGTICNIISIHFSKDDVYKLGTTSRIPHSQKPDFDYSTIPSLKEEFKDYFDVGCSIEPWDMDQYEELLTSQFSVITTENQMKGHVVQTAEDEWNFNTVDRMVKWCEERGLEMRCHVLWYHGNHYKNFFKDENGNAVTREEALKRMENHVKTKMSRYKGRIKYYDVVNEIFDPGSGALKGYMEEAQIIGPGEYVPYLFKWARETDPDATLILVDNSHLIPAQRNGIIAQTKKWLEEGVPIDAIGLQWHENLFVNEADMRDLFEKLRELGLPVYITELDMSAYHNSDRVTSYAWEDRELVKDAMARMYATMFDIFREYSDIIECVSFWNPTDNRSTETFGNRYNYPLCFDMNGEPSANFWAAIDDEKTLPRYTDDIKSWPELRKKYPDGYEPLIAPVYKGTPVIDGKIDDIWNKAEKLPVVKYCVGQGGAVGEVRILWDDDNLYVLGEVKDSTPDATSAEAWNRDCLELYVSQSNLHVTWLGGGDAQYRIDPTGTMQKITEGICIPTADGYIYEVKLPMEVIKPKPGTMYSFEAGIADAEGGIKQSMSKWCDTTDMSYQHSVYWGDIIISDGSTPIPDVSFAAPSETQNNENKNTTSIGDYSDNSLVFNGEKTDVKLLNDNGTSMISLRDFLTLTNANVRTAASGFMEIKKDGKVISLYINDTVAVVNGIENNMGIAPFIVDKKVWLPLRFLFESIGMQVEWRGETSEIAVTQ